MAAEAHFIETIIGVGILLFAAKLMAELRGEHWAGHLEALRVEHWAGYLVVWKGE